MSGAFYTFLPWYRAGLGAAVDAGAGDRAALKVGADAKAGKDAADAAIAVPARRIELIGPGDVLGLDRRAIVRMTPTPFSNDFEPNYLAAIEFFDEDFVHRHTPRAAGAELLPWIALVVLEEGEFRREGAALIVPDAGLLTPPADLAKWAHVHLNTLEANAGAPASLAQALADDPARGCSRLLSPRRLRQGSVYHAFVVPTFEAGRVAALPGEARRAAELAWDAAGSAKLPVYHEWSFRTGPAGSFEDLVERLRARPADPMVGRRRADMRDPLPEADVPKIANGAGEPVLDIEGALQVPNAQQPAWSGAGRDGFQAWLAGFVNLAEAWTLDASNVVETGLKLPHGAKLPVVLPPSYGRWQADLPTLDPSQADARWPEQLNLDPRNRVAAAYGTLVVQRNQEDFVARAWAQYGELFAANRLRQRGQLFRGVLAAMTAKHLAALPAERLLAVTAPVHPRIPVEASLTLHGRLRGSLLDAAAPTPALRRALRPGGALPRRFGVRDAALGTAIAGVAAGRLRPAPPLAPPPARLLPDTADRRGSGGSLRALSPEELSREGAEEVRGAPGWAPRREAPRGEQFGRLDSAPSEASREFSFAGWNFRQAVLNHADLLAMPVEIAEPRPPFDIAAAASALRDALDPRRTVPAHIGRRFVLPKGLDGPRFDPLDPIMPYPVLDDATYAHLRIIADSLVVPNLGLIANNTITLLKVNWRFIESFLVGVNHEMGRELLWRGYPTDQRGSPFRQFWDVAGIPGARDAEGRIREERKDIHPIHGWRLGGALRPLGGNRPEAATTKANLVLVVRGDLLRRYPNTQVFAIRAIPNPPGAGRPPGFEALKRKPAAETAADKREPVFEAQFGADVRCYGFDLDATEAKGPDKDDIGKAAVAQGWYFVLSERFGEPRFGLDEPEEAATFGSFAAGGANEASWAALAASADGLAAMKRIEIAGAAAPGNGTLTLDGPPGATAIWGADSAQLAAILLQQPVRMYFHARDMLAEHTA